jgi:hypothetical protein
LYDEFLQRITLKRIRKTIEGSMNIPTTLITLQVGLISYFIKGNSNFISTFFPRFFLLLNVKSLIIAVYFLFRAFTGFEYMYLPKPQELYDYELKIEVNNAKVDVDKEEHKENFDSYLKRKFAEIANHNNIINGVREDFIANSKRAIIFGLIFSVMLLLIYITPIFIQ